jgi:hypothetical protein
VEPKSKKNSNTNKNKKPHSLLLRKVTRREGEWEGGTNKNKKKYCGMDAKEILHALSCLIFFNFIVIIDLHISR